MSGETEGDLPEQLSHKNVNKKSKIKKNYHPKQWQKH